MKIFKLILNVVIIALSFYIGVQYGSSLEKDIDVKNEAVVLPAKDKLKVVVDKDDGDDLFNDNRKPVNNEVKKPIVEEKIAPVIEDKKVENRNNNINNNVNNNNNVNVNVNTINEKKEDIMSEEDKKLLESLDKPIEAKQNVNNKVENINSVQNDNVKINEIEKKSEEKIENKALRQVPAEKVKEKMKLEDIDENNIDDINLDDIDLEGIDLDKIEIE